MQNNNNSYQAPMAGNNMPQQQQQQRTYENIDAAAYNTTGTNQFAAPKSGGGHVSSSAAYYPSPPNALLSKPTQMMQSMLGPKGVNVELLNSKLFYIFFYAAFGSLFPLMGIFFKQHGLSTAMTGLLIGIRPFIEFAATPVWARVADKLPHPRALLLLSLALWMSFTVTISFVQPQALKCFVRVNATSSELVDPSAIAEYGATKEALSFGQFLPRDHVYGLSPIPIHRYAEHLIPWNLIGIADEDEEDEKDDERDEKLEKEEEEEEEEEEEREEEEEAREGKKKHKAKGGTKKVHAIDKEHEISYVKPPLSSMVFSNTSVKHTFLLLFLITIIGEFFSAPAVTLADLATLSILGPEGQPQYGKQRMFGSIGWGASMLIMGVILDHMTMFAHHPCGEFRDHHEKNYTLCFTMFAIMMVLSMFIATQLRFDRIADNSQHITSGLAAMRQQPMDMSTETPPTKMPDAYADNVIARAFRPNYGEWKLAVRRNLNLRNGSVIFVAWFMGFGAGIVFAFLFWHLQDLGGTPTLFGFASIINHLSEIGAYIFSGLLIAQLNLTVTHILSICVGLNAFRFFTISMLSHAWLILPLQCIQGVTHAVTWAALCSYLSLNILDEDRGAMQGVLQAVHHGLGRGSGAIIGGLLAVSHGTEGLFWGYGIAAVFVLAAFLAVNFYFARGSDAYMGEATLQGRGVGDENLFPAPHGVPGGALIRNNPMATSPAVTPHGGVDGMHQQQQQQGYQQSAYNANIANNQFGGGGSGYPAGRGSGIGGGMPQQQQQQQAMAAGPGIGSFWEQ